MRKAAFTLIELLVVIAILGVLAGLMLPRIAGFIESAREATCRSNLKNLHAAAINYTNDGGDKVLPRAAWWRGLDTRTGVLDYQNSWIAGLTLNGTDRGTFEQARDAVFTNPAEVRLAIEFGTLFGYTGMVGGHVGNKNIYWCPAAKIALAKSNGVSAARICVTYVMNAAFGCGGTGTSRSLFGLGDFDGYVLDPGRVLLFAEIVHDNSAAFANPGPPGVIGEPGRRFALYPAANNRNAQSFGCYHAGRTKGIPEGLVIFLDGHIEKHPALYGDGSTATNRAWRLIRGLSADGL